MRRLLWHETRTFFGMKTHSIYCRKCGWSLEPGDDYHRFVYRVGIGKDSRLEIIVEHDYDCDYDPYEDELSGLMSTSIPTKSKKIAAFIPRRRKAA